MIALEVLQQLLEGAPRTALAAGGPALERVLAELSAEGWTVEPQPDGTLGAYGEDVAFGPVALALWAHRLGLSPAPSFVDDTDSTNGDLRRAASEGAPHGTSRVAGRQRQGRGRRGRAWTDTPGDGLALSVVVRTALPAARLPGLGLAVAVAVADACGPELCIKWPNDVLSPRGGKVAGILAEAEPASGVVVFGVGVNANRTPADQPLAACLRDVDGDARCRAELAVRIVRGVLDEVALATAQPEQSLDRWRARSSTLGARVRVAGVEGIAVDITPTGALCIRRADGVTSTVHAGDVEMVDTARW